MSEVTNGPTQSSQDDAPLISENIRKYLDRKTLWNFTPEARHQIALLEEELFQLKSQRLTIMRREGELIYLLHEIILQEKYMQLREEQRKTLTIPDNVKTEEQRTRADAVTSGIEKINERRDLMLKDMEEERERENEDDNEREEDFKKLKLEWEEMKMTDDIITLPEEPNQKMNSSLASINVSKRRRKECILF